VGFVFWWLGRIWHGICPQWSLNKYICNPYSMKDSDRVFGGIFSAHNAEECSLAVSATSDATDCRWRRGKNGLVWNF